MPTAKIRTRGVAWYRKGARWRKQRCPGELALRLPLLCRRIVRKERIGIAVMQRDDTALAGIAADDVRLAILIKINGSKRKWLTRILLHRADQGDPPV